MCDMDDYDYKADSTRQQQPRSEVSGEQTATAETQGDKS